MFDYATTDQRSIETYSRALRKLGFGLPLLHGADNKIACGTVLEASVQGTLDGGDGAGSLLRRICHLAEERVPVTIALRAFGSEGAAVDALQGFCELVHSALSWRGQSTSDIGLSIHSHVLPLHRFCQVSDSVLGNGPRFVFLDGLQMRKHGNRRVRERTEENWAYLWRQRRASRPLLPAYGGIVRSICPLLGEEVAASVMPVSGLSAPAGSAWLSLELSLMRFVNGNGSIDEERLVGAIPAALELADGLLDHVAWPGSAQRADAVENRRLAISVTGLGDLVLASGRDPTDFRCLNWLGGIVQRIRSELISSSARLAAEAGLLPALCRPDPAADWCAGPQRDGWRREWRSAVRKLAVRHRNLLVMSPYDIFPRAPVRTWHYSDLLPLIAYADAWSFADAPRMSDWSRAEYRRFHQRARATIQCGGGVSLVAAGV